MFVTKKTIFLGGDASPIIQPRAFVLWRALSFWTTFTATQKPLSFPSARLFTTTCTRANKAAGYRPFVFVLFVFVSLEEDKEEDKDEKEGFGVSLGVVRV